MSGPKGHLYYEMQRWTLIAEELVAHVEAMRDHAESIMAYCTGECHDCPIRKICDWDRNIEYENSMATDLEVMVDFVCRSEEHDRKIEEESSVRFPVYERWEDDNDE